MRLTNIYLFLDPHFFSIFHIKLCFLINALTLIQSNTFPVAELLMFFGSSD
jgi:hypothetical protein